jgi:hypothetical protein
MLVVVVMLQNVAQNKYLMLSDWLVYQLVT